MDFRRAILILALSLCGTATADIITVVDVVETATANVNVPTSTNGQLTFKPCSDDCDAELISVRLTPETQFIINGQRVDFADFRREFYKLRRGGDDYALVSYDMEKRIVTSVRLGQ